MLPTSIFLIFRIILGFRAVFWAFRHPGGAWRLGGTIFQHSAREATQATNAGPATAVASQFIAAHQCSMTAVSSLLDITLHAELMVNFLLKKGQQAARVL